METLRQAASRAAYPLVMAASLTLAAVLLPRAGTTATVMILTLAVALVCAALERVLPYRLEWAAPRAPREARTELVTDALHMLVSMGVVIAAFRAVLFGSLHALSAKASAALGFVPWPRAWPLAAQLGLALVVGELGYYAVHRLTHERPLAWRIHAAHHSVRRLYWLNAGAFHPFDALANYAFEVAPLVALGAGDEALALYAVFTASNGMLKHANVDLRHGFLNWIFSTAELHRWHHARDPAEGNTNYGSNLVLWDLLLGTFHLPPDRDPPVDIGLAGEIEFPRDYLGQLRSPFLRNSSIE